MKHNVNKPLSLLLALMMVLSLPLPARAEGDSGNTGSGTVSSEARDITVEFPVGTHTDGIVKFNDGAVTIDGAESSIVSALESRCLEATGSKLSYISQINLSPLQGTLYDGYSGEGDTGSGVAMLDKYYADSSSSLWIGNIQFVPAVSFTGNAKISYYGYSVDKHAYSGVIYIAVSKQVPGISYSTEGEAVAFDEDHFSAYSLAVYGRSFRFVSFELPGRLEGALYYNYIDEDVYQYAVKASDRYYRNNTPNVNKVFFVPHPDFVGTVVLRFSGETTSGDAMSGQLTIIVSGSGANHTPRADGPFVYSVKSGRSVSLNDKDFVSQSNTELGQEFAHFTLTSLPEKSKGVLYDDSADGTDHAAAIGVAYGKPSDIRFAANSGFTGVVSIPIVVAGKDGGWFDSMLRFDVTAGDTGTQPLHYTVEPEHRAYLITSDFSDACFSATGFDIQRIHFNSLPDSSKGALYFDGSTPVDASANTYYYKDQIADLSFLAATDFDGSLEIPFTGYAVGYSSTNGRSFTGKVTIASTVIAESDKTPIGGAVTPARYSSDGSAVQFDQRGVMDAASAALPGVPVTIVLTRPDEACGRLCMDFVSLSRCTEFQPRLTYPLSDLSRVWFVPRVGYNGTVRIPYVVRDAKGNSYGGNITVAVSQPSSSAYFSDMGNARWAVPSVDLLHSYGIINGTTSTSYSPSAGMRRGDFILLLSRTFAFPDAGTASFADVPASKYYANAIAAAKSLGIVSGRSSDRFYPQNTITREDAALYLYRALSRVEDLEVRGLEDLVRFSDYESISPDAVAAMSALVRRGVFNGDDGRLQPKRTLTRAETAAILARALT